ncbi:MAG: hypothetical protein WAU36_06145 [Cyclobacteriaceae bacterium]
MKFNITLICLGLALLSCNSWAQNALPSQMKIRNTLEGMSDLGGLGQSDMFQGVDIEAGRILGDYYLDAKWNTSSVLMYGSGKVIEGYPVKYDIEGNSLEVKVGAQIKLIKVSRVESLIWYDSITNVPRAFVNAKDYSENGVELNGLLEVLVDGDIPLIKKTTIWVKRPDYVIAFDVGSKDTQINKREVFYYAKGKELFEIKKKKELIALFGDKGDEVNRFIKVNQLNVKEQRGLASAFLHYNSLVSKE